MAKLYFRYGAMNPGKSTGLLQAPFNYEDRDHSRVPTSNIGLRHRYAASLTGCKVLVGEAGDSIATGTRRPLSATPGPADHPTNNPTMSALASAPDGSRP
ncbi:hypothetical protein GCM10023081_44810 [Arthrobacter ginkgonis]|uniref:Thymidine kinase n=1 Tax=Arthrobacter ginkgonis TaxID=1630594 RepID=A0ABP7DBM7_9MICC